MTDLEMLIAASCAAVVIFLIDFISLLIAYISYRMIFRRKRQSYDPYFGLEGEKYEPYRDKLSEVIEGISKEDFEMLYITARDGTRLAARYYERVPGAPLHMIFHGYKSSPLRDGSGGGCDSRRMGHNLLLVYQRAHGESGGSTITFGIRERYDVVDWVNYMTAKLGERQEIILIGTSMGAASVLMASELGLAKTVKCIIADSPYTSPKQVIMNSVRAMGYPSLFSPFIALGARIFGGFSICEASTTEAVRRSDKPILIAHGESDSIVPVEMAREIAASAREAGRDVTLMTFTGAEHCMSFIVDYEGYVEKRNEFLSLHLKGFQKSEKKYENK